MATRTQALEPMVASAVALANGVTLSYVEQGDPKGTPVVFLHGLTDSWRSFEHVMPELPQSLRLLAISQRGHGDSDKPKESYTPRDFSQDVACFLDAVGVRRAIVVGHSLGAANGMRFAADYPERTEGLVLIGAFGEPLDNPDMLELQRSFAGLSDPIDRQFARDFQESTLALPVPPSFLDTWVGESLKVPARVWRAALDNFLAADFDWTMRKTAAPTMIIWGTRDNVVLRSDQDALLAGLRDARLEVYEGAGHAVHWEDPARVAADIAAFIASLRVSPWPRKP